MPPKTQIDSLLATLKEIINELPQSTHDDLRSPDALTQLRARLKLIQLELMTKLTEEISRSDLLPETGLMRVFMTMASSMDADTIATWLVERGSVIGAAAALGELQAYSTAESFPAREVLVLDGVTVDETLELTAEIQLRPLASLKTTMMRDQFSADAAVGMGRSRVALVRLFEHPVVLRHADAPYPERLTLTPDLRDVARILTLLRGVAPFIVAQWYEHDESIPSRSSTTGASASMGFEAQFLPARVTQEAAKEVREWLQLAQTCPPELWATLRVVLDRLNAAKRRRGVVDRSIELGIAAEALFLRFGGEDLAELSFRLAVRAAWLLGASHPERVVVYDIFRALYEARSKAVHNGVVPDVVRKMDVKEMLTKGCELLERAVVKTLSQPGHDLQHLHLGPLEHSPAS